MDVCAGIVGEDQSTTKGSQSSLDAWVADSFEDRSLGDAVSVSLLQEGCDILFDFLKQAFARFARGPGRCAA